MINMWYDIIKQEENYYIQLAAYGDEINVAISNYSMGLTDTLDLLEITRSRDGKRKSKKAFKKLVKAIFMKIYSEIFNDMNMNGVIEKQKFYDIVNSRLDRIYITKEQVDPRTNKIFTKRIELNKFIKIGHAKESYEIYYKYSRRKLPVPMRDLVQEGYIESVSAKSLAENQEPFGPKPSEQTMQRRASGLYIPFERKADNSFIKRRDVPPIRYLSQLAPFMQKTQLPRGELVGRLPDRSRPRI